MTICSSVLNKSAVIIIIMNLKSYVPKHVRFYEQTKRSGIVSGLSRIGLRFGRMRMAANVFVHDLVNDDSNFVR